MALDRPAQLEQGRVRRGPQLEVEGRFDPLECRQRIGRSTGPVLGKHEPAGQALVGRITGNEPGQLGDDGLVLADGEAGIGPVHLGGAAQRVEARRLGSREEARRVAVEGRAAPREQGARQLLGRAPRLPDEQLVGLAELGLEAPRIDLVRAGREPVGRAAGDDPPGKQSPEGRDLRLERVLGRGRWVVAPQLVDQPVTRDEPVGLHEQGRQQGARARTTQPERHAVLDHLEWSEDAKIKRHPRSCPPLTPTSRQG